MARIRSIKPDFFRHGRLFDAERETGLPLRLAFAGLWTVADREGRFRWSPREIKLDCLPYDQVDFSSVLNALETYGFIAKYVIAGCEYGYIPSWKTHQVINVREAQSKLPAPDMHVRAPDMHVHAREAHGPARETQVHKPGEGKGKEVSKSPIQEEEPIKGTYRPPLRAIDGRVS